MDRKLHQVEFRVHFKADHPKAGEFEFGKLILWLYACDEKSAAEDAIHILSFLPYEIGAGKSRAFDWDAKLEDFQIQCASLAETIGFNIALFHWPKGTDENKVAGTWPYYIPFINVN